MTQCDPFFVVFSKLKQTNKQKSFLLVLFHTKRRSINIKTNHASKRQSAAESCFSTSQPISACFDNCENRMKVL